MGSRYTYRSTPTRLEGLELQPTSLKLWAPYTQRNLVANEETYPAMKVHVLGYPRHDL